MEKTSLYQDRTFKRIVVASTGLGLACMLASVAAIRIGHGTGLSFGWHWSIVVVTLSVVLWNWRFWDLLWALQEEATEKKKRKLGVHLGILLLLGIACFLYPIRFIAQGYMNGIVKGLLTAGSFLGTMFWLIYKSGKALGEIDATEIQRLENAARSAK